MADPDVSHNVPGITLFKEQANSKEEESSDDDDRSFRRRIGICDPSSSSKLEKNPVTLKKNPMLFSKTLTVIGRPFQKIRIMMDCLSLSAQISTLASKMVRHFDQDEREADGAAHWDALKSVWTRGFSRDGAEKFADSQWWNSFQKGTNKVRFEYCETSQNELVYVRAIQGHSGGETLSREFMNHVLLPLKWKDIKYHKGSVFNMKSNMADGLIPGGNKSGRHTVFSLHLVRWDLIMKT